MEGTVGMKQVLIVVDRRFVAVDTIRQIEKSLLQVGIQTRFFLVKEQPRPVEVYSFDNLPEATMEVFRNFIEAEAVVKEA